MAMSNKLIFQFSNKKTDGDQAMSDLLGSKGANLAEMSKIGFNVPLTGFAAADRNRVKCKNSNGFDNSIIQN